MFPTLASFLLPTWLAWSLLAFGFAACVSGITLYAWRTAPSDEARLPRTLRMGVAGMIAVTIVFRLIFYLGAGTHAGSSTLHVLNYGLFILGGVLLAQGLTVWFARREWSAAEEPRITHHAWELGLYNFVVGVLGAGLVYKIINWSTMAERPEQLANPTGGLVYYGAAFAGWATTYVYGRRTGLSFWRMGDLGFIGSLGQAVGRLGCYAVGCCFGRVVPASFPWAVTFPPYTLQGTVRMPSPAYAAQSTDVRYVLESTGEVFSHAVPGAVRIADWISWHGQALPVHPSQLYEAAGQAALFVVMLIFRGWRRFEGQTFGAWLIGYAAVRGSVEFFRGDVERGTLHGLVGAIPLGAWYDFSTSQLISLVVAALGLAVLTVRSRTAAKTA